MSRALKTYPNASERPHDSKILLFLSPGQRLIYELETKQPRSAAMAIEIMKRMLGRKQ